MMPTACRRNSISHLAKEQGGFFSCLIHLPSDGFCPENIRAKRVLAGSHRYRREGQFQKCNMRATA